MDSGSQSNFVTKAFVTRLGGHIGSAHVNVVGFGQQVQPVMGKTSIFFKARTSSYCKTILSLVTETITGPIPEQDVNLNGWDLSDITLADPEFHLSRPVDMLLGVSVMFDILRNGNMDIGNYKNNAHIFCAITKLYLPTNQVNNYRLYRIRRWDGLLEVT